jgi:hypothetical protein
MCFEKTAYLSFLWILLQLEKLAYASLQRKLYRVSAKVNTPIVKLLLVKTFGFFEPELG